MAGTSEQAALAGMAALGERIVSAARLAVAVHLFQSLGTATQHDGQSFAIGGAGPRRTPATADRGHSRRPFRICSLDAVNDAAHVRGFDAEAGSK